MNEPLATPPQRHPLAPSTDLPPLPAPPARRPRYALHAGLFALTSFTLALTGGTFWGGLGGDAWLDPSMWLAAILEGAPYALWVLAILTAHEMGHYLACVRYRIPASLPYFVPGPPILVGSFGALIRIRGRIPHRRALFDVAAAGPIAGFAIALPVFVVGILVASPVTEPPVPGGMSIGPPILWYVLLEGLRADDTPIQINQLIAAGWVGMLVTSLNLFPVGQLDGGHAVYAISRKLHRVMARLSLALLLGVMLFQAVALRQIPAYTVWFAILLWMRDRHPPLVDETDRLGAARQLLAVVLLLIFVLSFIPIPIIIHDG